MPYRSHHPHPIRRFFLEPRTAQPDPYMFVASLVVAGVWFFLAFNVNLLIGRLTTACFGAAFLCEGSADILPQRRGIIATSIRFLGGSFLIVAALLSFGTVFSLVN